MMKMLRPAALAGFFLALAVPVLALAADAVPAPTVLDLRPLIETAAQILIGVVSGVGVWLARLVAAKLKIQADAEATAALERAILNGITLGGHKVTDLVVAKLPEVRIQNALVAEAANYVLTTMPDTVRRFGLTADDVRERVRARLPLPAIPAAPQP